MSQAIDQKNIKNPATISTLKKRPDFLRVAGFQKKWVSGSMILQIAPTPKEILDENSTIRIGYTASKKVGNAVNRNRARRRLREVVREILPKVGQVSHDYVLIARPATVDVPYEHLIRDFSWCVKRLKSHKGNDKSAKKPEQGAIK